MTKHNQNGFTLLNTRLRRVVRDDSTGFIPMIIMIILLIIAFFWLVYRRVASNG